MPVAVVPDGVPSNGTWLVTGGEGLFFSGVVTVLVPLLPTAIEFRVNVLGGLPERDFVDDALVTGSFFCVADNCLTQYPRPASRAFFSAAT